MRKIFFIILSLSALVGGRSFSLAAETAHPASVIAYYFHGSFRCFTCNAMEAYAREAVETNFQDELASGKVEFRSVNVETRGNEHFARDYQLYTKAIVLSLVKDGREKKFKNLDKIWQLARDKGKFIAYVTGEVNSLLKETE